MEPERRAEDSRVSQLIEDVAALRTATDLNTEITVEIRNIMASFAIVARIAKWLTVVVVFITSALALAKGIITFNDVPR